MTVPTNFVATSGTGASPITADNFNSLVQGGMLLATARGFSGVQNQEISLIGNVSTNDGGQGNFVWTLGTGTDDGGVTTIVPTGNTSGYWARITLGTTTTLASLTVTGATSLAGLTASGNVSVSGTTTLTGALTAPSISFSGTNGIVGTVTNNNATAGSVGEYVSSTIASGSAVSLTTVTPANITSISLTAGDWDVWLDANFLGGSSTTVASLQATINTISATLSTTPGNFTDIGYVSGAIFSIVTTETLKVGIVRYSLASTTTVYGVAEASFGTSTLAVYGILRARRVR